MAAANRKTAPDLRAELCASASRYSLFQLVYLLEKYGVGLVDAPEAANVGYRYSNTHELLRFRPEASLKFSVGDVSALEYISDGEQEHFLLTSTCLGLYGTTSPLPSIYTEAIIASDLDDHQRREFLDLFHHRVYSLFYRTWKKYRYYLEYKAGAADLFSDRIFSLIGLAPAVRSHCIPKRHPSEEERTEHSDDVAGYARLDWIRLLSYTGVLNMRVRPPALMAQVVSHYFRGLPVDIKPCVERWVKIEESECNRMGMMSCSLGDDFVVGERVLDRAGKFEIVIGPIGYDRFRALLPGGREHPVIKALIKYLLIDQLDFDIRLILRRRETPPWTLSDNGTVQLGWSCWSQGLGPGDPEVVFRGRAGL